MPVGSLPFEIVAISETGLPGKVVPEAAPVIVTVASAGEAWRAAAETTLQDTATAKTRIGSKRHDFLRIVRVSEPFSPLIAGYCALH